MLYPTELKQHILDNNITNIHRLSRSNKITKPFQEFIDLCKSLNVDTSLFNLYTFVTLRTSILDNLPLPVCHCGRPTYYSNTKIGFIAARCSVACRSSDKNYRNSISKAKSALYSDENWKKITEEKKTSTTLKNHGVKYPMQKLELFEKQQASCFEKDENGLHGYEPVIYPFLKNLYPDLVKGTDYIKSSNLSIEWKDDSQKLHRSYPDFYSENLHCFIEIKSSYTRKLHDYKVMKCKDRLHNMGYGYILITVSPNSSYVIENYNLEFVNDE